MGLIRASQTTAQRIAAGIRRLEHTPLGKHGAKPSLVHPPPPNVELAFELTENMPEVHDPDDEYAALVRDWNPSANSGKGGYVTGVTTVIVRDTREVGYYGASGHKGMCKLRFTSTGSRFGEIIDMECP